MFHIQIETETGNAAFVDNVPSETARILRALADKLDRAGILPDYCPLYDINGNKVGFAQEEQEEAESEPCPEHRQPLERCPARCWIPARP